MSGAYDDIIDLPHHVSAARAQAPLADRAVQFSPFAALTGLDAAMAETARLTEARIELDEGAAEAVDAALAALRAHMAERPAAAVAYFLPDEKKSGGKYVTHRGRVRRLDETARLLLFEDGTRVPLDDIAEIDGDVLADAPEETQEA